MAIETFLFTLAWLAAGVALGAKAISSKRNSLLTFISLGCFLASITSFVGAPLALQLVVFSAGTLATLIVEEI